MTDLQEAWPDPPAVQTVLIEELQGGEGERSYCAVYYWTFATVHCKKYYLILKKPADSIIYSPQVGERSNCAVYYWTFATVHCKINTSFRKKPADSIIQSTGRRALGW